MCLLLEARPGLAPKMGLAPCSPQGQAQAENSSDPTPRDRAEPLVPECLRRFLGFSSFPPPSPFSSLRRPAWRFWQFFCFLPFWHCCLFGIVAFLALLPFGSPPPPAACSARPAGVALSISHLYPASKHKWKHRNAGLKPETGFFWW